MIQRFSIATLFCEGGVFLLLVLLAAPLAGQTLRLSDLVTTPTVTREALPEGDGPVPPRPVSLKDLSTESLPIYFEGLEIDLKYQREAVALRTTDLITSWLPREASEYGTALWYRARAYRGLGEKEKLIALSQEYLKRFPKGKERGWFLVRLAEEKEETGKLNDAVIVWKVVIKEKHQLTKEDALMGARLLVRTGFARDARQLLPKEDLRPQEEMVLMESLLVVDDPQIAAPEGIVPTTKGNAAFELRRGLLLEARNQRELARECYARLGEYRRLLNDEEQRILKDRRANLDEVFWPPKMKKQKTNGK